MPHKFRIRPIWLYSLAVSLTCFVGSPARAAGKITLQSGAFANGANIPVRYTCGGDNQSPALNWSGVPGGARSLTLIVRDPDAPSGNFIHWVVYNLPPDRSSLPTDVPTKDTIAGGGEQGLNGAGGIGYRGPCPPPGKPHHYHFELYAVDKKLDLKPGADVSQVESAMKGHVLSETDLIGMFGR